MNDIEKVSKFEFQVWRIKRWFFLNAVSVMLVIGLVLAVWAVLSIDIPLIPKVPCSFSDETIKGLNDLGDYRSNRRNRITRTIQNTQSTQNNPSTPLYQFSTFNFQFITASRPNTAN